MEARLLSLFLFVSGIVWKVAVEEQEEAPDWKRVAVAETLWQADLALSQ